MPVDQGLAARVAEAETAAETARSALDAAHEALSTIQQRISETAQAQATIAAKRADGTITDTDRSELLLLAADLASLRESLTEAESRASVAQAEFETASRHLSDARSVWERHLAAGRMAVLQAKACALDSLLIACLRELGVEANAAGIRTFTTAWRPSESLRVTVTHGRAP